MYRGHRDPMLGITIRQSFCQELITTSGTWVEIFVPKPGLFTRDMLSWPSIVVEPAHVFFLDDNWNEFFINAGADIGLCYKSPDGAGNRVITTRETEISELILARFLAYECWARTGFELSMRYLYHDFMKSGLKMSAYVNQRFC